MARARNIKPGFYQNDLLAECSVWARLLFPGLWMNADRDGKLEDRPARIKASVFPYDNVNVEKLLAELHNRGFIRRYEVAGSKYLQIINFKKHQNPHCKEPESTIPDAPPECDCNGQARCESGARTVLIPDENRSGPAESPIPLPDSPSPLTESPIPTPPDLANDGFDSFWRAWPKKVARAAAQRAWKRLSPGIDLQQRIIADIALRRKCEQWNKNGGQFIPNPSTYLAGRRWEDEVPASGVGADSVRLKIIETGNEFIRRGEQ